MKEVKLLHAIYSRPSDLLAKAEQDGAELIAAVAAQDKPRARVALFNFAVTAYHVWDWTKAVRPDLEGKRPHPLAQYTSLAICRDLANASKHAVLQVTKGAYKRYPPVVQDFVVSVAPSPAAVEPGVGSRWRMKVQLKAGRRFTVEELVSETIRDWRQYFIANGIK